ncbi:hypothetical protein ACLMJK_007888 [Lecanora helva]
MPQTGESSLKPEWEAEVKVLELVLICTQSLFKSRKTLTEGCFDNAMRSCKTIVRRTASSEQVRNAIGSNPQMWKDMHDTFALATPVLEAQSLAAEDPQAGAPVSSSALMAMNHDTLMKDLERVNDILLIARNVLATTNKIQNLAGESLLDQQILKLIDLCVRVTARGYDGDAGSRTELQWGDVIGSYKKLLITCLQFLYNLIQENEQRKLLLWLDLFANSKVQNEYAAGTLPPGLDRDHLSAKLVDPPLKGTAMEDSTNLPQTSSTFKQDNSGTIQSESREELLRDIELVTESAESMERMSLNGQSLPNGEFMQAQGTSQPSDKPSVNASTQEIQFGSVKPDRGDEFGALRTPESAAVTLQAAKDQMMARLADTASGVVNEDDLDSIPFPTDGDINGQNTASDSEEEYRSPGEPGDQERGLLTDIPLVLGPQEIEALPMIIQIAICAGQGSVMHGRDMQGMRCNILLAGDPGRNLLRELLIFIAAWDLQDDEIYFKFMLQIMESILENGLMPYAYQTFSEVKDIVSPAQSMVVKLLTQVFRGKQGLPFVPAEKAWTAANPHTSATRRVDIYVVRYIFTQFRQCIIPETCALIYLQGQIKAGFALPEDFPLNLWDMERVYEGVYQFLEFFAVLTEAEKWKDLLVNWEIVNELVTLLRELEASIPKAPVNVPQTVAEAHRQAATQQQSDHQQRTSQPQPASNTPAPVAVERPFDVAPTTDGSFAAPSPLSQTDSQDQVEIDAADPSDFEWRNLKKLVILVLSSLVWKSPLVQKQIRQFGGVEMVLACCTYDGNNPYIREHAVMCLRFLLENSEENKALVRSMDKVSIGAGHEGNGSIVLPESTSRQSQRRPIKSLDDV